MLRTILQQEIVKGKDREELSKDHAINRRWREYFEEISDRDDLPILVKVHEMHDEFNINTDTISKDEIKSALKDTNNGKGNIPVELLNAEITMAVNILLLYDIFLSVWDKGGVPWKKGIIIKLPTDGWLVVLRINVDLAIFQPYLDFEAGENQSWSRR